MEPSHAAVSSRRVGSVLISYHSAMQAAFLGSCNGICLLNSQLLSREFHDVTFPAEEQTVGLHLSATFIPMWHAGCTGWLEAIPQFSFGLAIPGPEFAVGHHLWLFPVPPLCVCLNWVSNWLFLWSPSRMCPAMVPWEFFAMCDVYHQCGHPAYFDLSVRSTTQPSYIFLLLLVLGLLLQLGS